MIVMVVISELAVAVVAKMVAPMMTAMVAAMTVTKALMVAREAQVVVEALLEVKGSAGVAVAMLTKTPDGSVSTFGTGVNDAAMARLHTMILCAHGLIVLGRIIVQPHKYFVVASAR
jgi:hypothetical protein